jgi:copper chaperone CopZ
VLALAFAAFPNYVGFLLAGGGDADDAVAAEVADVTRTYAIDGMTCEACAGHLRETLAGLPGVAAAEVSYADGQARITFEPGAPGNDAAVLAALAAEGYRASATPAATDAR